MAMHAPEMVVNEDSTSPMMASSQMPAPQIRSTNLISTLSDPQANVKTEKDFEARLPTACLAEAGGISNTGGGGGRGGGDYSNDAIAPNSSLMQSQKTQRESLLRTHEEQLRQMDMKVQIARKNATAAAPPSEKRKPGRKILKRLSRNVESMPQGTGTGNMLFGNASRVEEATTPSNWKRTLRPYQVIRKGMLVQVELGDADGRHVASLGTRHTVESAQILGLTSSPPICASSKTCVRCNAVYAVLKREHHCTNCGASVCDDCSPCRWPSWAMPPLFVPSVGSNKQKKKIDHRVCAACDKETASFKVALMAGELQQAITIFQNGNINLTSSFPFDPITREKPIHIAASSGSIPLVKWLVIDMHVSSSNIMAGNSDSDGLTVLEYAARNLDVDMLAWLVRTGACRVHEVKDAKVLADALHATLQLHTLDAETEKFVASLEIASADVAGDAGLGVVVEPGVVGATQGAQFSVTAPSSVLTATPATATPVVTGAPATNWRPQQGISF